MDRLFYLCCRHQSSLYAQNSFICLVHKTACAVDISQGCMLRTFVFDLYIGELAVMLMEILSIFISKTMSNVNIVC